MIQTKNYVMRNLLDGETFRWRIVCVTKTNLQMAAITNLRELININLNKAFCCCLTLTIL